MNLNRIRFRFNLKLWKLQRTIDGLVPFFCFRCGKLTLSRDGFRVQSTLRTWHTVCRQCNTDLYGE